MKINIITVGKLKEKYWTDAVVEYKKRISRFADYNIIELPEGKSLDTEAKDIIEKLNGYVIVMDIDGKQLSSVELAETMQGAFSAGKSTISFVIGSSEGLSDEVKKKADIRVSFGRVTYPHQLMRVILSEQIYRAFTIINRLTYHK